MSTPTLRRRPVRVLVAGLAAAALLASLAGCTRRIADLTLMSNMNVPDVPPPVARGVEGSHCSIINAFTGPSLEEAVDRAQRAAGTGNSLANVAVYYSQYWLLLVWGCYRVKADVVEFGAHPGASAQRTGSDATP